MPETARFQGFERGVRAVVKRAPKSGPRQGFAQSEENGGLDGPETAIFSLDFKGPNPPEFPCSAASTARDRAAPDRHVSEPFNGVLTVR